MIQIYKSLNTIIGMINDKTGQYGKFERVYFNLFVWYCHFG